MTIINSKKERVLTHQRMMYDYAFKKTLMSTTKEGDLILKRFLEVFLDTKITKLTLVPTEILAPTAEGKNVIADLLVNIDDSYIVQIEMQVNTVLETFVNRLIYSDALILSRIKLRGDPFLTLTPLIQLGILRQNKFNGKSNNRVFTMSNLIHKEVLTDVWKIIMIELDKVNTNVHSYCTLTKIEQYSIFY